MLAIEIFRELAWRCLADWPRMIGEQPRVAVLREMMETLRELQHFIKSNQSVKLNAGLEHLGHMVLLELVGENPLLLSQMIEAGMIEQAAA